MAASACGNLSLCCSSYKTGGSSNAYKIRVRKERCVAYVSFVNLDSTLDVSKWPQPAVEMQWVLPEEPGCKLQVDCGGLANSVCLPDPSSAKERKCLCKTGFKWDPINGICQNIKCKKLRGCKRKKSLAPVIGGSAFAVVAMLIGGSSAFIIKRRGRNVARSAQFSLTKFREDILNANSSTGKSAKNFITKATNNFSKDNLLGSGGFGDLFKATLDDGTVTAVKKAKAGNIKGIDQILNEVRILCQVNHRSLVRLMGCCLELEQPLLIYEYVPKDPNGTLFDHLHGSYHSATKRVSLTWATRLTIAHQTAEGLAYLHDSVEPRIYHVP
ncbi:wall-associated receptor kinase-like 20 [Rosa sericea]